MRIRIFVEGGCLRSVWTDAPTATCDCELIDMDDTETRKACRARLEQLEKLNQTGKGKMREVWF